MSSSLKVWHPILADGSALTQAMAFLTQYRNLRGTNPRGLGEVEFNFGRALHQLSECPSCEPCSIWIMFLGLYSHAAKQYQKVIDMAETGQVSWWSSLGFDWLLNWEFFIFFTLVQDTTFVREAAYNLSLIYVLTNATPLADSLYRRWLSIW